MTILVIGLDSSLLDKRSTAAIRAIAYGNLVSHYYVIVPYHENRELQLSTSVTVYGVGGRNKLMQLIGIRRLAEKIMQQELVHVVSCQDQYFLGALGVLLAHRFKVGLQIQVHGWEKRYRLRSLVTRFVLRQATTVRVVSQRLKIELMNRYHVSKTKIFVIPITPSIAEKVHEKKIDPPQANSSECIRFLSVGRLVSIKRVKLQIDALKILRKQGISATLTIVGDGPERPRLERMVCKYAMTPFVHLTGWLSHEKLARAYTQADVFLFTSVYEGWGMAVIEAARAGLAIIMTDVGCAREVIVHKKNGLIIGEPISKCLVAAMIELVRTPELRLKLGHAASMTARHLQSFEELLPSHLIAWQATVRSV